MSDEHTNGRWWETAVSRRNVLRGGLIGGAGLAAAALIGCGDDEEEPVATPAPASTQAPEATSAPAPVSAADPANGMLAAPGNPKRGGSVTTTFWGRLGNLDIFNGGHRGIMSQHFDTVTRLNPLDGLKTVIPALATSWEITPDGLNYNFSIRSGVQFHGGSTMTSEDVAMSMRRHMALGEFAAGGEWDPAADESRLPSRYAGGFNYVSHANAVDDSTVSIGLRSPRGYFLQMISAPQTGVYSEKDIKGEPVDLRENAAEGTGPFIFQEYRTDELTRFVKNPNYWNPELPYIDELIMLHERQWPARAAAILGGQAHYANIVPGEFYDRRDEFADRAGIIRHDGTGASLSYCLNTERKPYDDVRVRRAMFLGPNREAIIQISGDAMVLDSARWVSAVTPIATPIDQIRQIPGYRGDNADDLEEAKKLLAAAGFPDGFDGGRIVTNQNQNHSETLGPAFQAQIKQRLGINTEVAPTGQRGTALTDGDFEICLTVHFRAPVISEPVTGWKNAIHSDGSSNYGKYSNAEVDSIINAIDEELDPAAKQDMYNTGMDMLDADPPFYLLAYTQHSPMWANELKGHLEEVRGFTEEGTWDLFWLDK